MKNNDYGYCRFYRVKMKKKACLAYKSLKKISDGGVPNNGKCQKCKGLSPLESGNRS